MRICSETATTATTLPACGVGRCGGDVLDTANAHTGTGEGTESRLGTGAGGLGAVTTGGTDLDVEGRDAELLAAGGWCSLVQNSFPLLQFFRLRTDVLGSQHGGVGGGLVTVGLDLHATGDTRDGFAARQIGDVDEGIVERGEDAGNAEDELALTDLGTKLQKSSVQRSIADVQAQCRSWGRVAPGCSPAHRARPSSWEACWLCISLTG